MMGVFRSVSENAMGKSFPGDFLWVFPMGFHPHPLISYGFFPTFDIPGESIHQQLQKDLEHWILAGPAAPGSLQGRAATRRGGRAAAGESPAAAAAGGSQVAEDH